MICVKEEILKKRVLDALGLSSENIGEDEWEDIKKDDEVRGFIHGALVAMDDWAEARVRAEDLKREVMTESTAKASWRGGKT